MVMLLTVFALYLFTRDRIPLETAGLGILLLLLVDSSCGRWSATASGS